MSEQKCCCGPGTKIQIKGKNANRRNDSSVDTNDNSQKNIMTTTAKLQTADILGNIGVRLGYRRSNYTVMPGIYKIGNPDQDSLVLVTSNYKLTFDSLRCELTELNAWILVLDTNGVNVWCAAGKGTFGTDELISKINRTGLKNIVSHNKLILPQLGAPGVCAHEVLQKTGFKVIYGPVYARDIKKFIADGFKKTPEMSTVTFTLKERLAVIPVDLILSWKITFLILIAVAAAGILNSCHLLKAAEKEFALSGSQGASVQFMFFHSLIKQIAIDFMPYLGSIIAGCAAVPILLPYLPFRAFSLKGTICGAIWSLIIINAYNLTLIPAIAKFLIITSISAYFAMNFTGATTFTSQSGTEFEVKKSFRPILLFFISGVVLNILLTFKIL
ncbi:MAG: mercury methylation corrinoid protein HgcA [Candidatus Wallbacteria bacterium]